MGPVVEKKLFGKIPFGTEPLAVGDIVAPADRYLYGDHAKPYKVRHHAFRVKTICETFFKVSRGHAYWTYRKDQINRANLRVRSGGFPGLTKTIRWTE